MSPASRSTAMVVLASEQLWPNIHGIVHWNQNSALSHLCIYHTKNDKSQKPAERLQNLTKDLDEGIKVCSLDPPGGMQPEDVLAQIQKWQQEIPADHWVINATGGTKLMSAGAMEMAGKPRTQVVYRELESKWFELQRIDGQLRSTPLEIPADITDVIPVEALVRAQWHPRGDDAIEKQSPKELPIVDLVRTGIEVDWNWREVFKKNGLPYKERSGILFERFVAGVLLELGIRQLMCNVVARGGAESLHEIDLVGNHKGRVVIVDCKLRSEEDEEQGEVEAITSQIRIASETRKQLGGLSAKLILLRPNRRLSDAQRVLAETCGLTVLDQREAPTLIKSLAEAFGENELPDSLRQAEEMVLKAQKEGGICPYCGVPPEHKAIAQSQCPVGVIHLERWKNLLGQDWTAVSESGQITLKFPNVAGLGEAEVRSLMEALFGGCHRKTTLSKTRKWCEVILSGNPEGLPEIFQEALGHEFLEWAQQRIGN